MKAKPKIRRYQIGSKGHSKTLEGIHAYHEAKRVGKACLITAASEKEKFNLVVNHGVDPKDIRTQVEMTVMNHISRN